MIEYHVSQVVKQVNSEVRVRRRVVNGTHFLVSMVLAKGQQSG